MLVAGKVPSNMGMKIQLGTPCGNDQHMVVFKKLGKDGSSLKPISVYQNWIEVERQICETFLVCILFIRKWNPKQPFINGWKW